MTAFYNDNDRYAAEWLGNLIAAGHLPQGVVDDRSILEIDPAELGSFRQCHLFAGIGSWSYALQLAGWGDQECWTASCPCQPVSSAGQRRGHADERHLWPALYRLIAECRPATIFGEQVASKDGREWLAGVRADLEDIGYAVGCLDLCAASVGAPHIRQRLFWVADAEHNGPSAVFQSGRAQDRRGLLQSKGRGAYGRLADADQGQCGWIAAEERRRSEQQSERGRATGGLGDSHPDGLQARGQTAAALGYGRPTVANGDTSGLGNAANSGCCGLSSADRKQDQERSSEQKPHDVGEYAVRFERSGGNFWSDAEWLPCLDGKARRIESGIQPLANGVPARVGRLRAYGNAIVPQLAAEFIRAFREAS